MTHRRRFIVAGASALAGLSGQQIFAQSADEDYEDIATPFPSTYRLFGTKPALGPEEEQAREILKMAPLGKPLIETAQYFEQLTLANAESQKYNAQWPSRWNPVIVGFYQSTTLKDSYSYRQGDTIAWCAAFINWCLRRGGYKRTSSALSGSFRLGRGLGKATTSPNPGDIIVFRKAGPIEKDVGFGHVGIFIEEAPGGFMVLGGNQKAGKRHSSVNTTFFPEKGEQLLLASIRSFASVGKSP